eukprot:1556309-Prymnesium_polylepis.1
MAIGARSSFIALSVGVCSALQLGAVHVRPTRAPAVRMQQGEQPVVAEAAEVATTTEGRVVPTLASAETEAKRLKLLEQNPELAQ